MCVVGLVGALFDVAHACRLGAAGAPLDVASVLPDVVVASCLRRIAIPQNILADFVYRLSTWSAYDPHFRL